MTDPARQAFLDAVGALNDEGFHYALWLIYQTSTTAGGFTDHDGWLRVRQAAEAIPYIAESNAKLAAAEAKLDEQPPMVAKVLTGGAHDD